jgi:hypothetical protein
MPPKYNEAALIKWVREAAGYTGDHSLENVVHEVNASHAGQPQNVVDAHLRQRFSEASLPVKQPAFDEIVRLIAVNSLRS